jgi:hypothetical protein
MSTRDSKTSTKAEQARPFLPKPTTQAPKPDFSKYKLFRNLTPEEFVTDSGRTFKVIVIKSSVAAYKLALMEKGKTINTIKARKTNHRIRYRVGDQLLSPEEVILKKTIKKES